MSDLPVQEVLIEVVAPLSIPDVLNACAEARDLLGDVRRDLALRDGRPVDEAAIHLHRGMESILLAERYLLVHARETGADLTGLVGDVRRESPP
jgi:hypothetical protein